MIGAGDAIAVTVLRTAGSAPREAGASMLVHATGFEGTIGGGALEWEALRIARAMLAEGRDAHEQGFALGPALGQCCGGAVTLRFEAAEAVAKPEGLPLWIWGAGHVGRALVRVLAPLPDFAITWVDVATEKFPGGGPEVTRIVAAAPEVLVKRAPVAARHLVLTHSHEIDLSLCHALLGHGFGSAGVIGSATKWARFRARLKALGHSDAQISRIACPIGKKALGKHPQAIAVGVAAGLLIGSDGSRGMTIS